MKKLALIKNITQYALPICATNLLGMSVAFVVTMMLAQLGKTELAALAIANVCYMTLNAFLNTCLYSTSILMGQYHASENKTMVASIIWNSIWLSIILGLFGTALLWNADKFLLLIGQSPELVKYTVTFFHFAALTMIPLLLGSAISQVYNGMGRPVVSTIIIALRLPVNIFFCYELILGHYHLGLAGASCGLLLSQIVTLLLTFIYIRYSDIWHYFRMKTVKKWDWNQIKEIFNVGIHIGLQFLGELMAISGATFLMGYLGDVALASSQIVGQYSVLLIMIILGVSQALSIRVSEACGLKKYELINQYTYMALLMTLLLILFFAGIYLLMPLRFLALFMNIHEVQNNALLQLTEWLMLIAIPILLLDTIKNIFTSALRGLKNSKMPMLIGTGCLWFLSLPISYLAGIFYHGGPIALRVGFGSGYLIAAILLWGYFLRYKKQYLLAVK